MTWLLTILQICVVALVGLISALKAILANKAEDNNSHQVIRDQTLDSKDNQGRIIGSRGQTRDKMHQADRISQGQTRDRMREVDRIRQGQTRGNGR